ncbi:MAG: hypothetical protein Q7R49_02535 [Candidatus Daviesbacteria bacterium]|nr:hypothetical protein [Candidatus Daviesbacteria bacterium]
MAESYLDNVIEVFNTDIRETSKEKVARLVIGFRGELDIIYAQAARVVVGDEISLPGVYAFLSELTRAKDILDKSPRDRRINRRNEKGQFTSYKIAYQTAVKRLTTDYLSQPKLMPRRDHPVFALAEQKALWRLYWCALPEVCNLDNTCQKS